MERSSVATDVKSDPRLALHAVPLGLPEPGAGRHPVPSSPHLPILLRWVRWLDAEPAMKSELLNLSEAEVRETFGKPSSVVEQNGCVRWTFRARDLAGRRSVYDRGISLEFASGLVRQAEHY